MNGKPWTKEDLRILKRDYPNTSTWKLAERMQRPKSSIYKYAALLGIKKTDAFLKSKESGIFYPGHKKGKQTQFEPGHQPFNKGMKGWCAGGNSIKTQFKKGHRPASWKPIGSERITKDGYLQRKVTDTGYTPRDWKAVHIILWEQHHGQVSKGYIVIFKNGNKEDIRIDNLECISLAENMRRNSIHNYPKPLADVIRISGVLNRHINKRMGKHEKQDRRSEKSSVCHH